MPASTTTTSPASGSSCGPDCGSTFGPSKDDVPFADLQERLLFAEALEALHAYDSGVIESAAEANVGSLLGLGFPAWTGGVMRYVDQYEGGAVGFADRARELAARYGERFVPPAWLVGPVPALSSAAQKLSA